MKLIKQPEPFKSFEHECNICHAETLIEDPKDLFKVYIADTSDTWGSNAHHDYYYQCPGCQGSVYVQDEKIVPHHFRKLIKEGKP